MELLCRIRDDATVRDDDRAYHSSLLGLQPAWAALRATLRATDATLQDAGEQVREGYDLL